MLIVIKLLTKKIIFLLFHYLKLKKDYIIILLRNL